MDAHKYFLRNHAFVCPTKRYWIVLDSISDQYLCINREHFDALAPLAHGWHSNLSSSADQMISPDAVDLANALVARSIFSTKMADSKDVAPVRSIPAESALTAIDLQTSVAHATVHAYAFFRACAKANRWLQTRSLHETLQAISSRKHRALDKCDVFDVKKGIALVSVFSALRLTYPRHYLCMFDSLALLEFLAHYHVFPDWVFGVSADPFEAHCWVQTDSLVLNDTLDRVSVFVPILRV